MTSSLPQIFKKDLNQLYKPEKQLPQFSLYLRTNNFKPREIGTGQNRYNNTSTHKVNKSMDNAFRQSKNLNFKDDFEGKDPLKRLLSQRKHTHSKSMFIEQTKNEQIQQIDNFKTIRIRVLQELTLLQKSMQIVSKMQNSIKSDIQHFKCRQLQELQSFQGQMRRNIVRLMGSLKTLRRQTKAQIKVNKEQVTFLQQQFVNYKQIYEGFHAQQNTIRYNIVNDNAI